MNPAENGETLSTYALRFQERALRNIDEAVVHFIDTASEEVAEAWREGLDEAIASLGTLPRRYPLAPERFIREIRHMIYRRSEGAAAYRVFYTISGERSNAVDVPSVTILQVRHASARPLSRAELRDIENMNN